MQLALPFFNTILDLESRIKISDKAHNLPYCAVFLSGANHKLLRIIARFSFPLLETAASMHVRVFSDEFMGVV